MKTGVEKKQLQKQLLHLQTECTSLLPCNYIGSDLESAKLRETIIGNIITVAKDFGLHKTTAFLAISYFDRFLSYHALRDKLSLGANIHMVAFTCLLIAAKYSDTKLPPHSELKELFVSNVNIDDFVTIELEILGCLDWHMTHFTSPSTYICHIMKFLEMFQDPITEKVYDTWLKWIEVALHDSKFLDVKPCLTCVIALCNAWKALNLLSNVRHYIDDFCVICDCDSKEISSHIFQLYKSSERDIIKN